MLKNVTLRWIFWCQWLQPGKFRQTFCGFLAIFKFWNVWKSQKVQKGKKICHISNQHIEPGELNHDSQTACVTDRLKCILKGVWFQPREATHISSLPSRTRRCPAIISKQEGAKLYAPLLNTCSSFCGKVTQSLNICHFGFHQLSLPCCS